jgi:outer membrane protein TolC
MRGVIFSLLGGVALAGVGCVRYEARPLSPPATAASLETRSLADPGLRTFIATNLHRTLPEWPPSALDFDTLTLVAFYFHPSLDVARAQWGVARAAVTSAGGRPNPVLSAIPGYTLNPAAGVSPWIPAVTLDIPVETAGKRGHRIAQAQGLSEAARLNLTTVAWQVRANLRAALLDYTAAQHRTKLLDQQLAAQQQIVALLEQRFEAGAIARPELALPRLALARTGAEAADAQRAAAEARARIAEALGLPLKAVAEARFDFTLELPTGTLAKLTADAARQRALLGRADVLAALADYAATEAALQLEIAKQYPNVHISPGYQFDQGEHKWTLGISAELPVLNQNQGPIAEARARRQEAAARFVALQARIIAEVDRALAGLAATTDQVRRQVQLADLAREQSTAVDALLKAGAADQLELATAQLEARVNDLALLDAQVKAQAAVGQLEDAIQLPRDTWPILESGRIASAPSDQP